MIVVDANVIIYLVRETSFTSLSRDLYLKDNDWLAPELWEAEVLNGLLMEVRAGTLDIRDARLAFSNAATILAGKVRKCDPIAVLDTAKESGLTAYDGCYVVLARSLGIPLVTEDRLIRNKCPDVARSLMAFLGIEKHPGSIKERRSAYRTVRKTR